MKIIIVGCGKVGQTLAEQLNEEDNDITVVDVSEESVNALTAKLDIMGVVGNGATHTVQSQAGIDDADLLIAVTGSDELNLLCCITAKKSGNCKTIAQIKNPVYSADAPFLKNELGLAMIINPEYAAAEEIARVLRFPSALKIETFAKGRVELLKFRVPDDSPLDGMSVKETVTKLKCNVLICTVERDAGAYIANGDLVFKKRDVVSMIASPKNAHDFFSKIKYSSTPVKDTLIIGGGDISHYLCNILIGSGIRTKVIEKNAALCEQMATSLPAVTVINSDEGDRDVLLEEGLANTGAFIALTQSDEENIFLSLFAKRAGNAKIVTKINRVDFDDVVQHLELDSTIYPKNITADMIIRYVRATKNAQGSNVETLYNVIKGEVEAAEFTVRDGFPAAGLPISSLKLKPDVLIASIIRNDSVMIPRGNDHIAVGDSVIIVSKLALHDMTDILR